MIKLNAKSLSFLALLTILATGCSSRETIECKYEQVSMMKLHTLQYDYLDKAIEVQGEISEIHPSEKGAFWFNLKGISSGIVSVKAESKLYDVISTMPRGKVIAIRGKFREQCTAGLRITYVELESFIQ